MKQMFSEAKPGSIIHIPSGVCIFSEPLHLTSNNVSIEGMGPYQSVLKYAGKNNSMDIITVGDGMHAARNLEIKDFRISSSTRMRSGAALHLKSLARSSVENVTIDGQDGDGNLWDGIWFDGVDQVVHSGFDIKALNVGVALNGNPSGTRADLMMTSGKIFRGKIGLLVGGGFGGLTVNQVNIIGNDRNVVIDTSLVDSPNRELMFGPLTALDSAKSGPAVTIDDHLAGLNAWLQFSGTWFASGATEGIYIAPGVKWTISIQGGTIFNFRNNGIKIDSSVSNLIVNGTVIRHNAAWGVDNVPSDLKAGKSSSKGLVIITSPMFFQNKLGNVNNVQNAN